VVFDVLLRPVVTSPKDDLLGGAAAMAAAMGFELGLRLR